MENLKFDMNSEMGVIGYFSLAFKKRCRNMEYKNKDFIKNFSERKSRKYLASLTYTWRMLGDYISELENQSNELREFQERLEKIKHKGGFRKVA